MPKASQQASPIGRVLLTRPLVKSKELAAQLKDNGIDSVCCPLIDIVPINDPLLSHKLTGSDIIIAVSANAVYSASEQLSEWPDDKAYFAVGQATAQALNQHDLLAVTPHVHQTEGLLALESLQRVQGKYITILRGNGGRETLAQELTKRGARVEYSELYRRQIVEQHEGAVAQWRHQEITTIVVTSAEILQYLVSLVNNRENSWLANVIIIVPSERVAKLARQWGISRVEVSQGADNLAILDKILNLQSSFYEK